MISKLIQIVFLGLLLLLQMQAMAQSPSFSTYKNPVFPGAHADATLTRIGKDFASVTICMVTGNGFNPDCVLSILVFSHLTGIVKI